MPNLGPLSTRFCSRLETAFLAHLEVPSSKYQNLVVMPGMSPMSSMISIITSEESRGPKGSPCCTPAVDLRRWNPNLVSAALWYDHCMKANSWEKSYKTRFRNAFLLHALNAIFIFTLTQQNSSFPPMVLISFRAPWTAASSPRFTTIHILPCMHVSTINGFNAKQSTLPARPLRNSPTAIGHSRHHCLPMS